MTKFDYTIRTKTGLNYRHVGQLVVRAKAFVGPTITVTVNGESIRATQVMRLFALEIIQGCKVIITADGPWEKRQSLISKDFLNILFRKSKQKM